MKMKTYEIHFRHRNNPDGSKMLNDEFERVETTSKKHAVEFGRRVAAEREWWFMGVTIVKAPAVAG